ncbi:MAG: hypothetical protein R3C53_10040 [Pirellulaceae bacterium]
MTLDQIQQGPSTNRPRSPVSEDSVLVVRAAADSTPALKYRLWNPDYTLKPGSAQLHFFRAMLLWNQIPSEQRQEIETWSDDEAPQPTLAERRVVMDGLGNVFEELHLLAIAEDATWDHRLRDLRGPDMYAYLLPDVQESRALARLLDQKIRYQIEEQDLDGAVESLRDGFRLAAFVGQGETLVQQLVGIAIGGMMLGSVERVMQMPNSPNMYWALASLPRPFVDIRKSVEFELGGIHRVVPLLTEAETQTRSEAYWAQEWESLLSDFEELAGSNNSRLALAVVGLGGAEASKQRLVEAGMERQQVDAMPDLQAILVDTSRSIRVFSDELSKAQLLPGALGQQVAEKAHRKFEQWVRENERKSGAAVLMGLLFPAVQAASTAGARQEYLINRLMTIEALRMHAATHDGELPRKLSELDPVPALPNPFNGEAFDYRVEQDGQHSVITLSADVPRGFEYFKEIKVRLLAK